ncbi:hypothetical protein [Paenibacillus sp. PL91]|uniref:hypothetical protein n=1 Tax=Paenibacillus sp. PL91 TaxID=2729538 RepID=UPI0016594794|nr:hypothetical protein [Paenibacillus sp. PL91]MBC9203580.1 hypothetical protein [Paenibacillus sp. PL91]
MSSVWQPSCKPFQAQRVLYWVGVNVYNVKYHNGDKMHGASHEDPLDLLDYVYNRFSRTKPIQLSEFGVTHYNTSDGQKDNSFAINRISRFYRHLRNDNPRVKAVFYFAVKLQVKLTQDSRGTQTARILRKDGTKVAMAPVKAIQRKIWTGTKTRD